MFQIVKNSIFCTSVETCLCGNGTVYLRFHKKNVTSEEILLVLDCGVEFCYKGKLFIPGECKWNSYA